MSRLLLMRHGKAAWPEGVEDFERPLADRGRREAALAGDWIREHFVEVDLVLCSSARRTRETLTATGLDAPTRFLDQIYEAWSGDLLDAIHEADPQAETLVMIGHSPGMPSLAAQLANTRSRPALLNRIRAGFPTSAIAVLETDVPWSNLSTGDATLVDHLVPR